MHPTNDKIKVSIPEEGWFSDENGGRESGIVVEVPDEMIYFGFHSFLADNSLANTEILSKTLKFYQSLKGKRIFWEQLQDRGRRFKENGEEFVILNMSDVIGWTDDLKAEITIVDQAGSAGSFNLT